MCVCEFFFNFCDPWRATREIETIRLPEKRKSERKKTNKQKKRNPETLNVARDGTVAFKSFLLPRFCCVNYGDDEKRERGPTRSREQKKNNKSTTKQVLKQKKRFNRPASCEKPRRSTGQQNERRRKPRGKRN